MFPLVELAEVCSVKGGKRLPKGDELVEEITQHPYIRARDIGGGKINFTSPVYITDKTYKKISRYKVSKGDVIITIVGANIGDSAYVEEKFNGANLTENAVKLTTNGSMYAKFLKYALTPSYMKGYFQTISSGAAQGKLGLYKIKKVQVPKPPLPTQKKIACILSAYDDLIENNLKRIKLLEEMAQITYEQWFVRLKFPGHETAPKNTETGLPEGWSEITLDTACSVSGGGTPSKEVSEYWDNGDITWFSPTDLSKARNLVLLDSANKITAKGLAKSSAKLMQPNSFMMTSRATIGLFGVIKKPFATNQGFINVTPHEKEHKYFLLFNFKSRVQEFFNHASGATFPEISKSKFKRLKVYWPSDELLQNWHNFVSPNIDSISNLTEQNQRLKEARDILLPRLMTGMINVDHIELLNTKEEMEAA